MAELKQNSRKEPVFWHCLKLPEVIQKLKTNPDEGLTKEEVLLRQKAFGKNELPKQKGPSALQMLLAQFSSPLMYILLIAAGLTFWIKEYADMVVILLVVLVNATIGFFQEYRASKIFEKLKAIVQVEALVLRQGKLQSLDAKELVPGDVIVLKGGNKVPADARITSASNLETNEAVLTGESKPVRKLEGASAKKEAVVADRFNMVFMGTVIERGEAKAVVVATGARSEIGQITLLTQTAKEELSPLQEKVKKLGSFLSEVFLVISLAIFLLGLAQGDPFLAMFKTTIALAVAAIPEGLPAAISVILAVSSQKILKRQGLIRKLIAAETLGSTSVICTDKTGTLTLGEMKIERVIAADEKKLLLCLGLANEALLEDKDGKPAVKGEATDRAKLEKFLNGGFDLSKTLGSLPRLALLPFDENRKYLASFHQTPQNKLQIFLSGAPEAILKKSLLTGPQKAEIQKNYENLARQGFRIIAGAAKIKPFSQNQDWTIEKMTAEISGLDFLGLAVLRDPIRQDVKKAVTLTRQAGIKILMVTGDHMLTAKAIGLELGFKTAQDAVITGEDLDKLSDEALRKAIGDLEIFARVTPLHKMRIIDAWQTLGAVVAMTGDGVNDAPALKTADIGIAIGSGTDVSKEASDLVLLDDSFATITAAIAEGRAGFANIRKATLTVLTNSFTEILLITSTLIFHTPFPITAIQILWVNLVEDSLPVLAMAFEGAEEEIMKSRPTPSKEPILNKPSKFLIFATSIVGDILLVGIFLYLLKVVGWDILKVQSFIFVATATPTLFNVFAFKSLKTSILHIPLLNNRFLVFSVGVGFSMMLLAIYHPFFNRFLKTVPLGFGEALGSLLLFPLFKLLLVEATKKRFRKSL